MTHGQSVTTLWLVANYTAWWTEAHVCEQLAQGHYLAVPQPEVENATSGLQVRHITVTPSIHTQEKYCYKNIILKIQKQI